MTEKDIRSGMARRFPALAELGARRARSIPVIQTMTQSDCGAACLAMVLAGFGKSVRLEEVRGATGTNRDGVDALSLIDAARVYGVRGRGLRIDMHDLPHVEPGSILHWEFNHFVVFEGVGKRGVDLIDPAFGRRRVSLPEFQKSFTGVVLVFEPSDEFVPSAGVSRGTWRYFRRVLAEPGVVSKVLVTSILLQVFLLATPLLTAVLVDRIVPRGDQNLLWVLTAGFGFVLAFSFLTTWVRGNLLLHLKTVLDVRMTLGFLEHLVGLPYAFFQRRSAGDLIMRVNSNATMREILTSSTMSALLDGTLVSLYLILMFAISVRMALFVVGLGLLHVLVFAFARSVYRTLAAKDLHARAKSEGYLVELLNGIETLKSLGAESRAVQHWSNLFVNQLNVSIERGRIQALIASIMGTVQLASPLIVLIVGATLVLGGSLSLGSMLGLTALAVGFLAPLSSFIASALEVQVLRSYIERIDDVLETPLEQSRESVVAAPTLTGQIVLEHVGFRHSPVAAQAVRDVSVRIEPGQTVAIVGRSGAGKSTLARLLVGLYSPTEGRILFDGADLSSLDYRTVRGQVGIVPQHPFLFAGSIRENILLSSPARALQDAIDAAKQALVHDEIAAMPMGYDTILSDGGASLAAGQCQRIALARALVTKPSILLLDEATSALDTVNERHIQENLAAMRCTRVIIAHRLSTVVHADLILVMESGRIVERGTHDELLARRRVYASLVEAQLQERS